MELWPPEFEDLRADARAAVAAGSPFLRDMRPAVMPDDPVERVAAMREAMASIFVTVDDAEETQIAGVRCRVFRPERDARGVYLQFHGGGMVTGAPEMMDLPNLMLAKQHGLAVVSVDYRLGPEHPFPAGPDDGLAVAAWLLDNAERELGSPRLLVGGESAGAYMTAMTLLRVRDELGAADRFTGANLVFGVYDWGRSPSQRGIRPMEGPDVLDPEGIRFFTECFLPGMTDEERRDPRISPAFADLRGLPYALVTVGGTDHLLDDSLVLATRWCAAGNEVDLAVYPDLPHAFVAYDCELSRIALARIDTFFERLAS